MSWQAWGTLAIAVAGLLLSIYNTFAAHRRDHAQLRIVEDYVPIGADQSPPRYEIRLENRGHIPIALESLRISITGTPSTILVAKWPDVANRRFSLEPHRVESFQLPVDALYSVSRKRRAWIAVKTETAGTVIVRARTFWNFVADYGVLAEHERQRPTPRSNIPQ